MANEIHITGSGVTTIGHELHITGNGINRTKIIADSYTALINTANAQEITIADCSINFSVAGSNNTGYGTKLYNVLVDGATTQQSGGGANIIGCATLITGSTFQNCKWANNYSNARAVVDGFPLGGTISNCLFNSNSVGTAIFCYGTTITGCTFNNSGGVGVYNKASATIVTGSTFNNTTLRCGGWSITSSNYVWIKITDCIFNTSTIPTQNPLNLVEFFGNNILNNITISQTGQIKVNENAVVTTTSGNYWKINLSGSTKTVLNYGDITGCTITGKSHSSASLYLHGGSKINDCLITASTIAANNSHVKCYDNLNKRAIEVSGMTITGNIKSISGGGFESFDTDGRVCVSDSIIESYFLASNSTRWIYINNITFPLRGRLYYEGRLESYAPRVRLEDGSTVSAVGSTLSTSAMVMWNPCSLAIGVQNSDQTFYVNNGYITYIKPDKSKVRLQGIGSFIRIDGVNDFSPIYQFTSSASTGEDTLYYGVTTPSTGRWLVPRFTINSASVVLTSALSGRNTHFMTAAGEVIFGGTFSLPASSTISCTYGVDSAHSKVSITGGSLTLAGQNVMRGRLDVSNGIMLLAGSTVFGNNTGEAIIDLKTAGHMEARSAGTCVVRGIRLYHGTATSNSDSYGGGGGGFYCYGATNLTLNGYIYQCSSANRGGGVHIVSATNATISSLYVTGCRAGSLGAAVSIISSKPSLSYVYVNGTTTNNNGCAVFIELGSNVGTISRCYFYDNNKGNVTTYYDLQIYSGTVTITGSTINRVIISGATVYNKKCILTGFNKFSGCLKASAYSVIEIVSGATVNIQGMTEDITAGTISVLGNCTIVNTSGTSVTVTTGTYTTISTAGVAS